MSFCQEGFISVKIVKILSLSIKTGKNIYYFKIQFLEKLRQAQFDIKIYNT